MSVTELLEPVLTGGVRNAHFFNGRVLTAEDLRALQLAVATRQQQLGQAIGDGIVTGFEVSLDPTSEWNRPVVTIRKGLAINRRGDPLALTGDIELALVAEGAARAATEGEFAVCDQATVTLTNLGLYILVVLPASGFEGRVPMTTVGMEGISGSCGSKYAISGVRFRLVRVTLSSDSDPQSLTSRVTQHATELETQIGQLPPPNQPQPTVAAADVFRKVSLLRNGVAHLCFGTETISPLAGDPVVHFAGGLTALRAPGLVDELRRNGAITNCEVPLGLLYWTSQGLKYVDRWAVRRGCGVEAPPDGLTRAPDRTAAAEILQFQAHLTGLLDTRNLVLAPSLVALDLFTYLPPIGMLPLQGRGTQRSIDERVFFNGLTVSTPLFIEGARLGSVLRRSAEFPSVDLATGEMMWRYLVRENAQASALARQDRASRVLFFTSGHMPCLAPAQFDLSRWDYANYAGFLQPPYA
jgi:hypothetical protein